MPINLITAPYLADIEMPENLAIGLMISDHRRRCRDHGCDFDYAAYALGQSPFPVPPTVAAALQQATEHGEYVPAIGIPPLHDQLAAFWDHHFDQKIDPDRFIVVPGAKYAILMILAMLDGPLILPQPSWVGYLPLAQLFQKPVVRLPTPAADDYKITPASLENLARTIDAPQTLLMLNSPNNPSGAVYSATELAALAAVCERHNIIVISDEIYALSTYDASEFASMASVYPEGTFLVSGMSKFASAGGYRLGLTVLPTTCTEEQRFNFRKLGAATYANVSTPIQHAALAAFDTGPVIDDYIEVTRNIHRIMAADLRRRFLTLPGVRVSDPHGGFYFLADFNEWGEAINASGLSGSSDCMNALLAHPHHVAMLAGESCLLTPTDLSFRVAFVDYDGAAAMQRYGVNSPTTVEQEATFVEAVAPRMIDGVARLRAWLDAL